MFGGFYQGRTVGLTGHTGFKGAWLALWLRSLGAKVHGYSLPAPTNPCLHATTGPSALTSETIADIRDLSRMSAWLENVRPEVVFHLAAQPLVRLSYRDPMDTLTSCVIGTASVLEAVRTLGLRTRLVIVTTDKVYENLGWDHAYRESDPLGGHDPYSASKAAADIVTHAFRRSFLPPGSLATVRAGNVIGGGDYAEERIVPDIVRSLIRNEILQLRFPEATRPWQHVLDCLAGYLEVGARLDGAADFPAAFNFGPGPAGDRSVRELVEAFGRHWPVRWERKQAEAGLHEASRLNLAIDRSVARLGWCPVWNFERTVEATASWYACAHREQGTDLLGRTKSQLDQFCSDARSQGVAWATRTS